MKSQILETEARWTSAHREMDIGTISEILSMDYRQIQSDGTVIDREQLIKSYSSGDRHWEIAESSEHEIKIHGNTAIMIAKWRGKGVNAGEKFDYIGRFVCIYVLEESDWKIAFDMSTPVNNL